MRSVIVGLHIKALSDVIEVGLIAGVCALIADLAWVIHDINSNGLSAAYVFVASGLSSGLLLTAVALKNHHKLIAKEAARRLLTTKLNKQKQINLAKKHHKNKHKEGK